MADIAGVTAELGSLPAETKNAVSAAFRYVLNNLTLGGVDVGRRSKNFQWYWLQGTTPAVANTEFSIAHGLQKVPNIILPIVPLSEVGAQMVPLTISRAADANRVYLKSSSTSAPITLLVE
jgi:hypothetical protein